MKKLNLLWLAALVFGVTISANAQNRFGVIGGLNQANIEWNDLRSGGFNALKKINFGLSFGAGMSFAVGSAALFVESRYSLGLTNLDDGLIYQLSGEDYNTDVKTKDIQIMAGLTLPLGRQ